VNGSAAKEGTGHVEGKFVVGVDEIRV